MKKCLIIVDFQNDFVEGSLGFKDAKTIEPIIVGKIEEYLKEGHDLLFTFDTHYDDYLKTQEGKRLPIKHCLINTYGHELYGKVKDYQKDAKKLFNKNTFGSLDLGNYLKDQNYDEIELAGLVTNMCVISNAIIAKSALPEARIVVDRNASLSFNMELHHKTFDVLEGLQVDLI